jgi:hypothetical protein
MYLAKEHGKGRMVCERPPPDPSITEAAAPGKDPELDRSVAQGPP